jgi:hypothetical protein
MSQVLGRAMMTVADNVRRLGVPIETSIERLGRSEAELRDPLCRIPWDACADFLDEMEAACGGPDEFAHAFAGVQPALFSEVLPLLRFLLSPRDLYRMIHVSLGFIYLNVKVTERDCDDGRLIVTIDIPPPWRPSAAYFHACAGGMRTVPLIMGQPAVEVIAEVTERRGVFTIQLRESKTLVARMRRASVSFVARTACAEMERAWLETRRRVAELEASNARLLAATRRYEDEAMRRERAETALRAAEQAFAGASFRVAADGTLVQESDAAVAFAARLEQLAGATSRPLLNFA